MTDDSSQTAPWAGPEGPVGGALCLDLCNSVSGSHRAERREGLLTPRALLDWAQAAGALAPTEAAAADPDGRAATETLARLRELRDALYRCLTAELAGQPAAPADLAAITAAVAAARGAQRLEQTAAGYRWTLPAGAGVWRRLEWRVALSTAEVLGPDRPAPLRQCGRCSWLFLDRARGRGRQWCSSRRCGNRARVARHYRKSRARPT